MRFRWAVVPGAILVLCGCSSPGAARPSSTASVAAAVSHSGSSRTTSTASAAPAVSRSRSTITPQVGPQPPVVAGLTWHAAGSVVKGRPVTYLARTRRGTIALLWMDPQALEFRFIPGSIVPEGGPLKAADNNSATWAPRIAAAFNGAFRLRDNVGGYFYRGTTVKPLRSGLASLVIDGNGQMSVVRWGRDRTSTAGLEVVRQNLPMLIDNFTARTSSHDSTTRWGLANNNTPVANRSALAELPDGTLVYAYGQELTAHDLASTLVRIHSRIAIMLDMNLWQPAGFVYWHRAGTVTGRRILPTIHHAPAVYLVPHYKDFVVALIRP